MFRPHRALRRFGDDAAVVAPEPYDRRFLENIHAAARHAIGKAAQIIQRMDAAGAGIEHAADEDAGAGLVAHFPLVEDADLRIAHLALHPVGFVDRGLQRRLVVGGLDLAGARQRGTGDAKFGDQLLDNIGGFMRDPVHALRHGAAVHGVDLAEREAELCGDHAAIAATPAPARAVCFKHDRRKATLGDVVRSGQAGIARTDDHHIRLVLA